MTKDLEMRRRRASYRAHHRGTKEMDWLISRFADARLDHMEDPELSEFEALLAQPDPDLHNWIMAATPPSDPRFHALVTELRNFHGLNQ